MKKVLIMILFIISLLSISSCNKEDNKYTEKDKEIAASLNMDVETYCELYYDSFKNYYLANYEEDKGWTLEDCYELYGTYQFSIDKYYGIYDGCHIYLGDLNSGFAEYWYYKIGNSKFSRIGIADVILVYDGKNTYSLQDAYKNLLVSSYTVDIISSYFDYLTDGVPDSEFKEYSSVILEDKEILDKNEITNEINKIDTSKDSFSFTLNLYIDKNFINYNGFNYDFFDNLIGYKYASSITDSNNKIITTYIHENFGLKDVSYSDGIVSLSFDSSLSYRAGNNTSERLGPLDETIFSLNHLDYVKKVEIINK